MDELLLLLLPAVAVAGEDLDDLGVGLGVLFPAGFHLPDLVLGVEELEREGLVAGLEGGDVGEVGVREGAEENVEAEAEIGGEGEGERWGFFFDREFGNGKFFYSCFCCRSRKHCSHCLDLEVSSRSEAIYKNRDCSGRPLYIVYLSILLFGVLLRSLLYQHRCHLSELSRWFRALRYFEKKRS